MGKYKNCICRRTAFLLVVMMLLTSLAMTGCGKDDDLLIDVEYISAKLEGISELATAKLTMKGIIHVTDGKIPLLNKKEFYMLYSASVKAGFDLSKAEISVTDTMVQIKLPKVELLDVSVDERSLEFFDKHESLFNRTDLEDTAQAISAAKDDVLAQPEIDELKKTAKKQVEALLTGLLEGQIGSRTLKISIG